MKRSKFIEILTEGEGLKVEFKQKFSTHEKIAKEMIAFANTRGGTIFFGISDDAEIMGVESEKGEAELIEQAALNFCEPPVNFKIENLEFEGKEVVIVSIPESKVKPHRIQDYQDGININTANVYIRVNDKSVLASKEMIKILHARTQNLSIHHYQIGKNEQAVFDYLEKHETISVKELCDIANLSRRRASRTLIKMVRVDLLLIHTKDNGDTYFTYAGY